MKWQHLCCLCHVVSVQDGGPVTCSSPSHYHKSVMWLPRDRGIQTRDTLRDLPSKTGNRYSYLAGRAGKYGGMNWKIWSNSNGDCGMAFNIVIWNRISTFILPISVLCFLYFLMDPSEVEFVAEKEKISILTNFSENKIYLIGVCFVCRF